MQIKFDFRGLSGIVVVVIAVLVVITRLLSVGEVNDPALKKAVQQQLLIDSISEVSEYIKQKTYDEPDNLDIVNQLSLKLVDIKKLRTSQKLFSFSSVQDVVVHVEYSLQTNPNLTRESYLRFQYGAFSSDNSAWSYQFPSSKVSFYLNLF